MKRFIVAIDGPAACGKGTLALRLAKHYGLHHVDTGLIYRAVAYKLLQANASLEDEALAGSIAATVEATDLDSQLLSQHEIANAASKIAVMLSVREILVQQQRKLADSLGGAVLDGRDIGTCVYPDADVKLYIDAQAEIRAQRRYAQIIARGGSVSFETVLSDIQQRDARDTTRPYGALRPASDAYILDTSLLSADEVFIKACGFIDPVWQRA